MVDVLIGAVSAFVGAIIGFWLALRAKRGWYMWTGRYPKMSVSDYEKMGL